MNINNQIFFEELVRKVKEENRNSKYDIMVPFSGGKDGSFLLWLLSKYTNLKVLAFHIDNWYMKDEARENVERVCKKVGCDLVVVKPNWNYIKDVYKKLIMLKGEICMICDMMISLYPFTYATTNNIPFIAWDINPNRKKCEKIQSGYISSDYNYYTNTIKFYGGMMDSLYKFDMEHGEYVKEALLQNDEMKNHTLFPTFVNPFYWVGYDLNEIGAIVTKELGWESPVKADGIPSKCIINRFHIDLKNRINGVTDSNVITDGEFNKKILDDLGIDMFDDELANIVKNAKVDLILKLGSNLRQ